MTDFPVLRYLDVIIGLSVVALLASTIVASVTQLILSSTYSRARYLRDGLSDLVGQVDAETLGPQSRYIAERLLRHPLVARNATLFGDFTTWLRHKLFPQRKKLPLPSLNPPDTLQREEIVMLLLEWASEDGAMYQQDLALAEAWPQADPVLKKLRQALKDALAKRGVPDAAGSARAIRLEMIKNEAAHPEEAAQVWRSQAVTAAAPTDLVGRVNVWYDNSMSRVGQAFGLEAKVIASLIALPIVVAIQLDGINLIKRLTSDDQLRASLVQEADIQTKQIDDAQKKLATVTAGSVDATQAQKQEDDATLQREKIASSLADLRQPDRAIVPSYLLWQPVAQATLCLARVDKTTPITGAVTAGPTAQTFKAELHPGREQDEAGTAIRTSGAPLTVYDEGRCLRLVATSTGPASIQATVDGDFFTSEPKNGIDWFGFWPRIPGMLLMWILVSLGSPFWYDLLKKLLGLRSELAAKDDDEREAREDAEGPPQGVTVAPAAGPAPAQPRQPQ